MNYLERLFFRKDRIICAPISCEGRELETRSNCSTENDASTYARSTVIIGSTEASHKAHGEWKLTIPKHIRKDLIDLTLRFETIRTHGYVHTPIENKGRKKKARVYINGSIIDDITLVKEHPYGDDLGVDSRRNYHVVNYVKRANSAIELYIKIEVDENVAWDIDYVILEPIVERKSLKVWASMAFGVVLSIAIPFAFKCLPDLIDLICLTICCHC